VGDIGLNARLHRVTMTPECDHSRQNTIAGQFPDPACPDAQPIGQPGNRNKVIGPRRIGPGRFGRIVVQAEIEIGERVGVGFEVYLNFPAIVGGSKPSRKFRERFLSWAPRPPGRPGPPEGPVIARDSPCNRGSFDRGLMVLSTVGDGSPRYVSNADLYTYGLAGSRPFTDLAG